MQAYLINPADNTVSYATISDEEQGVLDALKCEKQDITFVEGFPDCELRIDAGGIHRVGNYGFRIDGDDTTYWGKALLIGFDIATGKASDITRDIDEVAESIHFFGVQSQVHCLTPETQEPEAQDQTCGDCSCHDLQMHTSVALEGSSCSGDCDRCQDGSCCSGDAS